MEEDKVLCMFLVQSLCSSGLGVREVEEACWVYVNFVEHPQASLSFSLFKA